MAGKHKRRNRLWRKPKKDNTASRRWNHSPWISVSATLITLAGVVLTYRQYEVSREQADLQKRVEIQRNAEALESNRARLAVVGSRLERPLGDGTPVELVLFVMNVGHLEASRVERRNQALAVPANAVLKIDPWSMEWMAQPPDPLLSTTIEPGVTKEILLGFPKFDEFARALGQWKEIRSGKSNVQMRGFLDYSTIGQVFRMRFCYQSVAIRQTAVVECLAGNESANVTGKQTPSGPVK